MKKNIALSLAVVFSMASMGAYAGEAYPIEVENSLGTTVIEDEVNAIAVFDVGMLDILDTLGFGDRVVAVTHGVSFPDYLSEYLSEQYIGLGGFKDWDEEALNESNPDLIFAGFRQNKSIDTVTAIAPTIYFEEAGTDGGSHLAVLEQRVKAVTDIFGGEEEAAGYLDEITEKAEKIKAFTAENEITYVTVTAENNGISLGGTGSDVLLVNDLGLISLYTSTNEGEGGGRGEGGQKGGGAAGEEGQKGGGAAEGEGQKGGGAAGEEGPEGGRGEGEEADNSEQTAETAAYINEQNPAYVFVFDKDAAEAEEGFMTAQEIVESAGIEAESQIIYLDDSIWYSAGGGLKSTSQQLDNVMELLGIE